jgi:hypothetical protein
VYLIGIGYLGNLTEAHIERMLTVMNYIRTLGTTSNDMPALFRHTAIPTSFIEKITDVSSMLADHQIIALQRMVAWLDKYTDTPTSELETATNLIFAKIREGKSNIWIAAQNIKTLSSEYHLIQRYQKRNYGRGQTHTTHSKMEM